MTNNDKQNLKSTQTKTDQDIEQAIQTSQAIQILIQKAQLMIEFSLIQDQIMNQLGMGKDKLQQWKQSLPEPVRNALDQFTQEIELVEKQAEIDFNYNSDQKTSK